MIVPRETFSEPEASAAKSDMMPALGLHPVDNSQVATAPLFQPVFDVREYRAHRKPVAHYLDEDALFATLPSEIKSELRLLLGVRKGGGIFGHVQHLVNGGYSVSSAIAEAAKHFVFPGSPKRTRARYDLWTQSKDWTCLVNCAKAGADWQEREDGLPLAFLKFCAAKIGGFKREDGKRQALLAIHRQWQTGRNADGEREEVPGYGFWQAWFKKTYPGKPLPLAAPEMEGWSYSNISTQIKARNLLPRSVRGLLHQGTAAAREFLPYVRSDRNTMGADGGPLRFLELVEFDDVKVDFLIRDEETGETCDLWLLVARDRATGMLLGFGMRPARTREDGSQEHLRLKDMKQISGWILERYGLPPYLCVWKLEHGTATLPPAYRTLFCDLLPGRIEISYSGMIGGKSPMGFEQRGIGNSRGKASLESHNRLMHTMLADRPGQTGPLYTKRPADLKAQAKECEAIFKTAQLLPEHVRGKMGYNLLSLNQAREHLFRVFRLQNERTEHELQGFEEVLEWYDEARGLWLNQSLLAASPIGLKTRKRKESPMERCARLVAPYREAWTFVSPEIIRAFYEHTVRDVVVKNSGLIEFRVDNRVFEFQPAPGAVSQIPGTRLLGYFHPDDPKFLHLTDGKGRIVGTWIRTTFACDNETLADAIRYQQSALKAAKEIAAEYTALERAKLESMRAENAALIQAHTFVPVTNSEAPSTTESQRPINSPVAAGLATVTEERTAMQARDTKAANEAARVICAPTPEEPADTAAADHLLAMLRGGKQ